MEERYLKYIENALGQLDKATSWIFLTLMVIILSSNKTDDYEFGDIKIKKGQSALVLYLILCGLNFQVLKYLQVLSSSFSFIKDKSIAIANIQYDTWVFNPFSRTTGIVGLFTDNIGLPILIILWWLGFALANKEISKTKQSKAASTIILLLFCLYLLFGLLSLIIIQDLLLRIGNNTDKLISQFIGIIVGVFVFYFVEKREKFLKVIFQQ
jgi:hypothetical protein